MSENIFEHINQRRLQIQANIEKSINPAFDIALKIASEGGTYEDFEKAIESEFEKGGKRAFLGEKRTFGGREYIKTVDGWKFHGKGTGIKAQEHAAGITAKTEKKTVEGSRGEKVIGHTKSGKPIYEDHRHPSHKEFSKEDHADAQKLHDDFVSERINENDYDRHKDTPKNRETSNRQDAAQYHFSSILSLKRKERESQADNISNAKAEEPTIKIGDKFFYQNPDGGVQEFKIIYDNSKDKGQTSYTFSVNGKNDEIRIIDVDVVKDLIKNKKLIKNKLNR